LTSVHLVGILRPRSIVSARLMTVPFLRALAIIVGLVAPTVPAYAQDSRLLITVIARDHDGLEFPLQGATVHVKRREDGNLVSTATTNQLGFVEIVVPSLRTYGYSVVATLDGYEPDMGLRRIEEDVWAPPGDVEVRYTLRMIPPPPGPDVGGPPPIFPDKGRIFGRVVLPDGTPLPRTSIQARGQRWGGNTETAEDGSFNIRLFPDVYTLHASGRTYTGSRVGSRNGDYPSPVVVASRRNSGPVDLVLEPFYLFYVSVIVTNDLGARVPSAKVEFIGDGVAANLPTGQDGVLTLGPFPPGRRTIVANANVDGTEFAGTTSADSLEADQEVSVVLMPAARMSGRVEFDGRSTPLHSTSALHVTAHVLGTTGTNSDRRALVGPEGQFTLTGLVGAMCLSVVNIPSPWYVVDITQQGRDITNKAVTFNPGEVAIDVLIRLERADGPIPERPKCKA
jgi:hypothetical protein